MALDPLILARIQFAANMTFHIMFPTITIALAWILLFFKLRFNRTKNPQWLDAYFFWTKIFALCFAIGVVSGITMSFQFGTNWPGFMKTVGNIAGPLLAYEVLTAFFLEATFLGIMLFGFRRVSNSIHNLATFLVAAGTTASAFWIIALNSWMHTPSGFKMIDGQAHAVSWMKIIFNPSMPFRLTHMMIASGLTATFLIAGISAFRWLKNDRSASVILALKTAIYAATLLIPLQIFIGDLHGLNTLKYQPQKIAAIEALWESKKGAPLVLLAIPDEKTKQNLATIEIPKMASLILTHELNGELKGLNEFENNHAPVAATFFAFRIMVAVAILMLLASWSSALVIFRKNNLNKPIAIFLCAMSFSGWIATISGWYVTEIGRQPWLVQGILKTADAAATNVTAPMITLTLTSYLIIYFLLISAFITTIFYMARKEITRTNGNS